MNETVAYFKFLGAAAETFVPEKQVF